MVSDIRLARESDADSIAAIYRPAVEESAISFEIAAPTGEEMARRMRETLVSYPWLVCDLDGRTGGYAYAARHSARSAYRWSVDTTVYIDQRCWRLGIGRGLYRSLFAILAAQGYFNAYAGIALPNPASVGLHESMGFEAVGVYRRVGYKFGAWRDVGWWQRPLRDPDALPEAPLDLAAIRQHESWNSLLARGESDIHSRVTW